MEHQFLLPHHQCVSYLRQVLQLALFLDCSADHLVHHRRSRYMHFHHHLQVLPDRSTIQHLHNPVFFLSVMAFQSDLSMVQAEYLLLIHRYRMHHLQSIRRTYLFHQSVYRRSPVPMSDLPILLLRRFLLP